MVINEISQYIVRPALDLVGLYSDQALKLILFTGFVESGYIHLVQIGSPHNGGLGFWQIERRTHIDVKKWLNNYANRPLKDRLLAACYLDILPEEDALIHNLRYACLISRLIYYRYSEPLPDAGDAKGMSLYHKKYYNGGDLGKADPVKNEEIYKKMFISS